MCAGPCRLPYDLICDNKTIDKGYLLSTKDLCGLEFIPFFVNSNVASLKIEGRMKTPEYVATVTRIYRKYIDLASNTDNFTIDPKDKQDLLQVFNRGNSSTGHLKNEPNKSIIYKEKPDNMGIYLGNITNIDKTKGHITTTLRSELSIGDSVCFENESSKYHVSELMIKKQNIKSGTPNSIVTFGRMKGNLHIGDKIFKIADKDLSTTALNSFSKEFKKSFLDCKLEFRPNEPIKISIYSDAFKICTSFVYDYIPEVAKTVGITKEKIITQFNKTCDTCFEFRDFDIDIYGDLFLPVSVLNDIRRTAVNNIQNCIINSFKRLSDATLPNCYIKNTEIKIPKTSILLNVLHLDFDYTKLKNVDNIYVPIKYFGDSNFKNVIFDLSKVAKLYVYLPTIVRKDYEFKLKSLLDFAKSNFDIYGIVVSNLSQFDLCHDLEIISNYTLNLYNSFSAEVLSDLGAKTITLSPELDRKTVEAFPNMNNELIVYGYIPVMNMNYCPFGKSNKCYKDCKKQCLYSSMIYLKDRFGAKYRVFLDNSQTITTIFNSKPLSVNFSDFNISSARFDFLDETILEINNIVSTLK